MDKTQEDWETEYAPDIRIFEILAERDKLAELAEAMALSVGCTGKAFQDYWDWRDSQEGE